ncbi:helix-turn-helix domain-containing protein [Thermodesulfobacteriota bacterium]
MKSFDGLNYYDILRIPANSSFIAIKRAYRDALAIYEEDSLSTYSLFADEEREGLLKVIEKAFYTLIDENKRAEYNHMLVDTGQIDASVLTKKTQKTPTALFETQKTLSIDDLTAKVKKKSNDANVRLLVDEVLSKDLISGRDLNTLREAFGVEISEIYAVTKISVTILKMIEDDHHESLPVEIYLRFFLRSYAEILQIDPQRIVDGYLKNMLEKPKKT